MHNNQKLKIPATALARTSLQ